MHGRESGKGRGCEGDAVIGIVAADMDFLVPFAPQVPVVADKLERCVVRFRAGIGKQHVLVPLGQEARELRGKFDGVRIRRLEEVVIIRKRAQCFATGVRQFLVAVAHLHAPQPRHPVDDLVAAGIPEIDAVGFGDHAHAFRIQCCGIGEGMHMMRGVERLPMLREVVGFADHVESRLSAG